MVERTIGSLSLSKRMSKDCERLSESSQAMVYAVMRRLMLRSLARARPSRTASSFPKCNNRCMKIEDSEDLRKLMVVTRLIDDWEPEDG